MYNLIVQKNLHRNIWLFYVINFLSNFWFFTPIAALFFVEQGGNVTAAMSVFAVMHITTSLFEIPTGVLGDKMPRKYVIVLSAIFALIPVTIYAFSSNLIHLLIGAGLAGFGNALSSGTGIAMGYETVKELGREKEYKKINAIWHTAFPVSIAIASLVGGFLATYSLRMPFMASIGSGILYVFFSLLLVEPTVHTQDHEDSWVKHAWESLIYLCTHRVQLCMLGIATLGWAISIQVMYKSISLLYEAGGMPLIYFGVIGTLTEVGSTLGMLSSYYFSKFWNDKTILLVNIPISIFTWYMVTVFSGVWIGIPMVITFFLLGIRVPIITHIVQINMPDKTRATILSIRNVIFTIVTAIAALGFGYMIDTASVRFAYRVMIGILALMILFTALLPNEKGTNR
jgi:MFS family permease